MKYFIDTEFAERPHTIELISVAIVAEDGREFYAEVRDFPDFVANDWVKQNVLPQLWSRKEKIEFPFCWTGENSNISGGLCHKFEIADDIKRFIGDDKPEFWGYFADYDWVVFCWLFGSMINLPKGWPMLCFDIKQMCVDLGNPTLPKNNNEHHALVDARWNKSTFAWLNDLRRQQLSILTGNNHDRQVIAENDVPPDSSEDKSTYELVVGPIEPNLDGFTAEDRKEWLEDAGWQKVRIQRL